MRLPGAKILHITTHLGGGVGRALSSIVTYERENTPRDSHKILLLDSPEKDQFVNICRRNGVEILLPEDGCDIGREMAAADIVIIHWWHHPVMARFLADFPRVPVRLVLWAHVNGCYYPFLPFRFAALPHRTFFTSPFSLENPGWTAKQREMIKRRSAVVYGLGALGPGRPAARGRASKDFIIGYTGTLNSGKIFPEFTALCVEVLKKVPSARFVLVGDVGKDNEILRQAKAFGIADRITFTGYTSRIEDELAKFDIFGYPLNPKHFGTTENALLEAMAYGLPAVVLDQNAEKYIVRGSRKGGLLAGDARQYADCVKYLHDHPRERERMGKRASEYVRKAFSFSGNVGRMRREIRKVLRLPRKTFEFRRVFGKAPYQWFLACLGEDRKTFAGSIDGKKGLGRGKAETEKRIRRCSPILKGRSKSSVSHFSEAFPGDAKLRYWKGLLEKQV